MMKNLNTVVLLGLAAFGMASAQTAPAPAAPAAPTTAPVLSQVITRTTTVAGKPVTKVIDSKTSLPGDTIKYTVQYNNKEKVTPKYGRLSLSLPVPANTTYKAQDCNLAATKAQYSISAPVLDKQKQISNLNTMKYGDAPLKKTVTVTENGKSVTKEVEVPPSEYTAVRWTLPELKAGDVASCSVTVVVK